MAQYIGKAPINGFHAKQTLTGDGSTTAFSLDQTVASETSMIVSVGGVLQEPAVAYNLSTGGTKISFTEAPSSTDTVYIHFLGKAIVQNLQDLNGAEFVLDANGNTSFTADTDDEIDIKVGGSDRSTIKATGFHNLDSIKFVAGTGDDMQMYHDGTNSYLTNSTGALKVATETSGIAITIGHTTSEVTIADNATVTGNLTVTGTLTQTGTQTFDGGIDVDNFNLNGTTLALSSGDMLIDVAGDITFDADGGDFKFSDGGTQILNIANSSSDVVIKPTVDAKDIIFQQYDGTAVLTIEDNGTANIPTGKLAINGTAVTSTAAELNLLDGVSGLVQADLTKLAAVDSTAAELNIVDGGTSATSTTVADADRVVMNDNGTMVQVAVTDLAAYFDDEITAMPNLVSVGALDSGSITSGFTSIDVGSGAMTTTGTITGGVVVADDVSIDGKAITMTGSSSDTAVFTAGTNGTLSIVTTDAAAAAANITITADGTAELAGTTVTLNSSGGVTLDADNGTITFADAGSSLGTITSSGYSGTAAVATTVTVTDNESTNENNVITFVAGADSDGGNVGLESDGNLTYNPSTGTLSATNLVVSGTQTITNSVTMNASNAVVFEGATADAHETTLTTIDATNDRTISLPNVGGTLPVLAAVSATAITSTPEEINLIDGGTARGTTAVASGDGILINDGGTMRMTNVDTVSTYFASHTVGGGNIVTTGALGSGSIATGFGAIDNGTSNVTTGGLLSLDTDADADDNTADSSSGRLTIGAGGDLNLYHGGTNSYIVNSTGSLYIHSETDDSDIIFTGEDGSSGITALTLDMSAAGAASFNGVVTANAGVVVDNITIDGTEIDLSSGDLTIDVAGDIILDADGGDINFKDAGTSIFHISNDNSGDVHLESQVSDKDIYIRGNDGGSTINAVQFDMSAAGAAIFNNDVTAFSDARLKDNVETIPNALETVCAMRGVNFTRNDNNDQPGTGVIAQEMQEVFPVVVKENNDEDNTLSVSYGNLVGVLIESIKELKAEIDTLKGV